MTTKSDQIKLALLARQGFQPLEELSTGIASAPEVVVKQGAHNVRIDHRSRWFWFPHDKLGFVLGFEVRVVMSLKEMKGLLDAL